MSLILVKLEEATRALHESTSRGVGALICEGLWDGSPKLGALGCNTREPCLERGASPLHALCPGLP